VHALGLNPRLFPEFEKGRGEIGSVLTSLDLSSRAVQQTLLDLPGGHMTCTLSDGSILCAAHHKPKSLVVDRKHRVIAELNTGPEHYFGGHGWIDEARSRIVLAQRRRIARGTADVGSLLIYDAKSFRLLDQVPSGGIHPHELHPIPGTDELAVTHYGDIADKHPTFEHNVVDAKLSILDARTLRPKRHYPQSTFNAMVTHMRVDETGWAHLVMTQYISWPESKNGNPYKTATEELAKAIGRPVDFEIPQAALEERLVPLPLPMLAVNTQTGERKVIRAGDRFHLRSQSLEYCSQAKAAVAVYSHSDTLVIARRDQQPTVVPAQRLGLRDMRGVVELPGTTRIAVMGAYRKVAVYDIVVDEVVSRYETSNYQDTHLSHDS
jgi:hypothetical protein